jgi:Concanavalin A-like lectin/glucanases superfamily
VARQFNGWTMAGQAPIGAGLSSTNRVTVALWMLVDNWDNPNGQVLCETGPQYDTLVTAGFACYSNGLVPFTVATYGQNGTYSIATFTNPSTGVWQHWAIVIDRSGTPPVSLGPVYINGVSQALTLTPGADSTNYPNATLNVFARNAASDFMGSHLFDMAVWGTVLNADEVLSLANKSARPDQIQSASLLGYWPMEGFVSPEPAAGGTTIDMSLTGGPTQVNDPPGFAIAFT